VELSSPGVSMQKIFGRKHVREQSSEAWTSAMLLSRPLILLSLSNQEHVHNIGILLLCFIVPVYSAYLGPMMCHSSLQIRHTAATTVCSRSTHCKTVSSKYKVLIIANYDNNYQG
jgi:hypothetical protein